ncbi:MAG: matrixin family metalloprotease [Gammaproteobacteria bacterium]
MRNTIVLGCALLLSVTPAAAQAYAFFGQPDAGVGSPQPLQTEGTPIVWPAGAVEVAMTLNFEDTYRDSALEAMQSAWNAVGTPLQYRAGTAAAQPCDTGDGVNTAGWKATSCDGSNFGDTLAVTLITHTRRNGRWEISDADIIVNSGRQPWLAHRDGPLVSGQYDFHRVFVHELGHALGLEHPDDADQEVTAIMNSRISDIDTLQDDDIRGLEFLYEGADTSSSSLSRDDSGGADGALALLALAGVCARRLIARRRRFAGRRRRV